MADGERHELEEDQARSAADLQYATSHMLFFF